jgi:malonyl-CoA/methylmalonyl-CoA synthetase
MPELPLIARAKSHRNSVAIRSELGESTYENLLNRSQSIASALLADVDDLHETRVAALLPAGPEYVATQWGVWRAGGIHLPLSLAATEPEWEYALTDSGAAIVLTTTAMASRIGSLCHRLSRRLLIVEEIASTTDRALPDIRPERRAMILYTSGTTSQPKGVVTTHANLQAQIESLVEAWEWQATDRIPLFLPLHHIHGVINVMGCALWSGATVETFEKFDTAAILGGVRAGAYTLFMAVPTIYVKLIEWFKAASDPERLAVAAAFRRLRLMVSGSAALPASVHDEWFRWTGQHLLERYGMTEIGMALSNPYRGERRPGSVGLALPGVEVRLRVETGELVTGEGVPGEIQVRGSGVFREYWNRPEITDDAFDDGWFRTGDVAVVESGYYRIMGRLSVDIIKSGGYKLSALEIESTLLEHPDIRECAVVGVGDATWGEAVAVAVVLKDHARLDLDGIREWCRERMSGYKTPKRLLVVASLPRNALGKVTKPAVRDLFAAIDRR